MKRTMAGMATIAAVLMLAALAGKLAFAEPGHRGMGLRGPMAGLAGPGAQFMFEALDLTPEQRETVDGIMETYRPQLKALRDRGRDSRRALRETTPDDPDFATVVARASQEAGENASQLVLLSAELRREVHAVLTAEQRAKALELRGEMRQRFQERRERRRARREQWSEDQ